jgi:hypothetical protein
MIVACILAGHPAPIDNLHHLSGAPQGVVRRARAADEGRAYHLAWQSRIEPSFWAARWGVACRLVTTLFKDEPGADDLPDFYAAEFPSQLGA